VTAADYLRGSMTDTTVLIPIGIPLGLQHPGRKPETVFRVRLGGKVFVLDDDKLGAWFLAHSMRHNRESLAATMRTDGVPEPVAAIESLLSGGLLVPTAVSAEGALLLASAYRLVPLMTGLAADSAGGCIVGVPGVAERAVGAVFYQVFSRSPSASSLLEALVGVLQEDRVGPGWTLDGLAAQFLGQLAEPLEHGVVALDKATRA
jgi:hypothetical protein